MRTRRYMSILIRCLIVLSVSCAGIGYWLGVIVNELIDTPPSIGVTIVCIVIASILAILSVVVLIGWIKFLLERYTR
jgi:hypothetical protein